jgi:hypothetical protein
MAVLGRSGVALGEERDHRGYVQALETDRSSEAEWI